MSPDVADDDPGQSSTKDWPTNDVPSPSAGSIKSDNEADEDIENSADAPLQPIQKRRRVTRACDECRRKKIKCDGKQPCTHCSVYSYECTYDKPSNRRRNPAPQYIEALESRLQRAESLLHKFMPDVDLADPNLDPAIQQEFRNRETARAQAQKVRQPPSQPDLSDAHITSMIDSIGQLDIDDRGGWDFHGVSSGAVFLRRMKEHFRGLMGPVGKAPFLPRPERTRGLANLDSPSPAATTSSPFPFVPTVPELPPKEVARKLCYYSLSCATCLVRIVHVPSFYEKFEKIYDRPLDNLSQEETHFLGLLFAVMALGCMYNNLEDDSGAAAFRDAIEEGTKYYNHARSLLQDITECRDLTSLQALLFIILFLQATSNLSGCYSFVGIALRSALKIGLHRHLQHEKLNTIEQEIRKRVFYVIRQMDIYVSTLLGFPLMLNVDDVDQPFPIEVDDEFITPNGILQPPPGVSSFFEAFNAHSQLMEILAKITKYVYPMKGLGQSVMKNNKPTSTYLISYGRIKEIEADLHSWFERLPQNWRPSADGPIEVVRVRHLLRFAYAHVQLVLYRPFLHYVSPRLSHGTKIDELSYACAAAAISVSRNIVHIGLEIRKQRVLSGPYWFMLYTEFFAVLSLVFYAIENPEKPGSGEVLADARAGRQMIAALADKSVAAERVSNALTVLFEQLPEQLDPNTIQIMPSRKRSAPMGRPSSVSSQQTTIPASISSRQTSDFTRSSQITTTSYATSFTPSTMEQMPVNTSSSFQDGGFSSAFNDFMSVDMQAQDTPDSTSTATSSQRHPYTGQPLGVHNPVNKLDSLMFPSEDPFAYPNQPMMELGYPGKTDPPSSVSPTGADMQLFLTGTFDDVESSLFGQPPPYMMHQQVQPMMNMESHVYDPSLMGLHSSNQSMASSASTHSQASRTAQSHAQAQAQAHARAQHQAHLMASRRANTQRAQERRIQQMFTEQGMQADWGGFFGSGRGGFQGMPIWPSTICGEARRESAFQVPAPVTGSTTTTTATTITTASPPARMASRPPVRPTSRPARAAKPLPKPAPTASPASPSRRTGSVSSVSSVNSASCLDFDLVLEDEFDALSIEVVKDGEKSPKTTSSSGNKYPAKLHARKVAAELGVTDGLIYLPGEPTRLYEDSDQSPPFKQRRYFYYLSGANFPDCAVTYEIANDRLTLWIPYVEPRQVLWYGATPTAAESMRRYDVDDVRYTTQLSRFLHGQLRPTTTLYILHPDQVPKLADRPRGQTHIDYSKLRPAMDQARVVKTDFEVELIRRAAAISSAAHRAVAENLLSMNNEQDIEALFLAECTSRGAHAQAYPIIAGSGSNASTLHYDANDQPLSNKQLIVVDAGCEWSCYASDITRTLPISGSFTPEAEAIYSIVQRMQDECIKRIKPGCVYYSLHLLASDVAIRGLLKLGILRGRFDDIQQAGTIAAFFPHGLGHHVGLEVHDVTGAERLLLRESGVRIEGGKREMMSPSTLHNMRRMASAPPPYHGRQALQPNMIVTVEPGIYFCRPFIEGYFLSNATHAKFIDSDVLEAYYDVGGVRIEDDILVTKDGYENLSSEAPKGDEMLDVINGSFEKI
ncbi:hypothetical protein BGZ63DRAFT_364201 [Mariannaea sp. PMI_226]|nr:hypothetical protein BGZ63DRAFT_364201 [Mariannaea sp. PMI_226]